MSDATTFPTLRAWAASESWCYIADSEDENLTHFVTEDDDELAVGDIRNELRALLAAHDAQDSDKRFWVEIGARLKAIEDWQWARDNSMEIMQATVAAVQDQFLAIAQRLNTMERGWHEATAAMEITALEERLASIEDDPFIHRASSMSVRLDSIERKLAELGMPPVAEPNIMPAAPPSGSTPAPQFSTASPQHSCSKCGGILPALFTDKSQWCRCTKFAFEPPASTPESVTAMQAVDAANAKPEGGDAQ